MWDTVNYLRTCIWLIFLNVKNIGNNLLKRQKNNFTYIRCLFEYIQRGCNSIVHISHRSLHCSYICEGVMVDHIMDTPIMAMWAPSGCSKASWLLLQYNRRLCHVRNTLTQNSHSNSIFMTSPLHARGYWYSTCVFIILGELANNTKQYLEFLWIWKFTVKPCTSSITLVKNECWKKHISLSRQLYIWCHC